MTQIIVVNSRQTNTQVIVHKVQEQDAVGFQSRYNRTANMPAIFRSDGSR